MAHLPSWTAIPVEEDKIIREKQAHCKSKRAFQAVGLFDVARANATLWDNGFSADRPHVFPIPVKIRLR